MPKHKAEIGKRYLRVQESIFHRTVHVLLNYSADDWVAWQKRKGIDNADKDQRAASNFAGFSTQIDSTVSPSEWIICLKEFNWTISDQGTLVHEIVHVIMKIFLFNNIPFNPDTQEFIAHAVGNLYEDIAGKIFRVKKRKTG
jgi:hypothetical protein